MRKILLPFCQSGDGDYRISICAEIAEKRGGNGSWAERVYRFDLLDCVAIRDFIGACTNFASLAGSLGFAYSVCLCGLVFDTEQSNLIRSPAY